MDDLFFYSLTEKQTDLIITALSKTINIVPGITFESAGEIIGIIQNQYANQVNAKKEKEASAKKITETLPKPINAKQEHY